MSGKIKISIKDKTKQEQSIHQQQLEIIMTILDNFIRYASSLNLLLETCPTSKIRMPNFPSEISENLVKFIIHHKLGFMPLWDGSVGDLHYNKTRIEVKCFSSSGPTSFGPAEKWDVLYFLDATNYTTKRFKCYKINMNDQQFGCIKVNKTQTVDDQRSQKRRPRIEFTQICQQIANDNVELIFDGSIDDLKIPSTSQPK